MAKAIMIQGTMSNVGKSLVTAGLCRIFLQDGYKVAPFKSQNMALNSYITKEGLEMGRAQVMQAEAAGIEPLVCMNPILLKPTNDTGSQVIVHGEVVATMSAREYFQYKRKLVPDIIKAYETLAQEYDIIVIEGAGSPAEINLKSEDIVNMGMAKLAKAPVLLVGDIDRGGVFASLVGTMALLEQEEKDFVKGMIINKFRGDVSILKPGVDMLEEMVQLPIVAVLPHMNIDIDDEDSLSQRLIEKTVVDLVHIVVIRLPRISNFTDFDPLESIPGVSLRYIQSINELQYADMIILPGSKNTMEDLLWLRQSGLEAAIIKAANQGTVVFGICGGYQMLGTTLKDPEGVECGGQMQGMGLLPVETIFQTQKIRTQVKGQFAVMEGMFSQLSQASFQGYEIHMGQSRITQQGKYLTCIHEVLGQPIHIKEGCMKDNIFGTYIHGIFDETTVRIPLLKALFEAKGLTMEQLDQYDMHTYKQMQYDRLAQQMREHIDMDAIYRILEEGIL